MDTSHSVLQVRFKGLEEVEVVAVLVVALDTLLRLGHAKELSLPIWCKLELITGELEPMGHICIEIGSGLNGWLLLLGYGEH